MEMLPSVHGFSAHFSGLKLVTRSMLKLIIYATFHKH